VRLSASSSAMALEYWWRTPLSSLTAAAKALLYMIAVHLSAAKRSERKCGLGLKLTLLGRFQLPRRMKREAGLGSDASAAFELPR
jgi:hypothetical protein